jgi:hypothetical protein
LLARAYRRGSIALRGLTCHGQWKGPATHEIVIRGGAIIDGTGQPGFTGDVAVDGVIVGGTGIVAA